MSTYLKLFENHTQYETFIRGGGVDTPFVKPNVSYCVQENEVHYNPLPPMHNGHEYVDLGLTSGTKWAKMNVGANSETDYGDYFMWGSTTPNTVNECTWANAPFNNGSSTFDETYFNSVKDTVCPNGVLAKDYDAAHVNWGGDWHMPNRAQCLELFKETKNGFVTNTGDFTQYAWSGSDSGGASTPTSTTATIRGWNTAGYLFFKRDVSDMDAAITSGDYLFVPAAGFCEDGEVLGVGVSGNVWASALYSEYVKDAWSFDFGGGRAGVLNGGRYGGSSVRGVVGQMDEITV